MKIVIHEQGSKWLIIFKTEDVEYWTKTSNPDVPYFIRDVGHYHPWDTFRKIRKGHKIRTSKMTPNKKKQHIDNTMMQFDIKHYGEVMN